MKTIRLLHINAKEQKFSILEIEKKLENFQALVGGLIERGTTYGPLEVYVDEEGLFKKYAYGFELDGKIFVGNGFVVALNRSGNDFTSVQVDLEPIKRSIKFLVRDQNEEAQEG